MKFGGVLMDGADNIKRSAKLVVDQLKKGDKVIVVVSAMSGVTDSLFNLARKAVAGEMDEVERVVSDIEQQHIKAAEQLATPELLPALKAEIRDLTASLSQILTSVSYLKELTDRSLDLIASFGERLSAPLMWAALTSQGVKSIHLTGGEAGIVTTSDFGAAKPIMSITERKVKEKLLPLLNQGYTPVVTGFIAADVNGVITTLGRGGSDYTATILAAALRADEVWIWKDVDGVMTADPKIVKNAKSIRSLSYDEAMELAYFGAKVLHPLTVTPVQELNIPIRIKNAFNPEFEGTVISSIGSKDRVVKAVTSIKNTAIITVGGAGMVGVPSVVARTFEALAKENVDVLMISQSSSMANISIVIQKKDLDKALEALKREFKEGNLVKEISVKDGVSVVAVVGEGMKGTPGVAAKVFSAVAERGVNVLMISQGSSELNISFAIEEKDLITAVNAVHAAFKLGES